MPLLSSAKDNVSEFVWSKTAVYSMVEVVAPKHEADDDDFGQHAIWIHMFPRLHDTFAERARLSVEMPCSFREEDWSADGAIEQRLEQCGDPDWMSSVEMSGDGRQVEKHDDLREGKRANHRRHEG